MMRATTGRRRGGAAVTNGEERSWGRGWRGGNEGERIAAGRTGLPSLQARGLPLLLDADGTNFGWRAGSASGVPYQSTYSWSHTLLSTAGAVAFRQRGQGALRGLMVWLLTRFLAWSLGHCSMVLMHEGMLLPARRHLFSSHTFSDCRPVATPCRGSA